MGHLGAHTLLCSSSCQLSITPKFPKHDPFRGHMAFLECFHRQRRPKVCDLLPAPLKWYRRQAPADAPASRREGCGGGEATRFRSLGGPAIAHTTGEMLTYTGKPLHSRAFPCGTQLDTLNRVGFWGAHFNIHIFIYVCMYICIYI